MSPRRRCTASVRLATWALMMGVFGALATSGCSFVILRPAPPRADWPSPVTPHSSQYRCTSSYGPPIVDGAIAATAGGVAFLERDRDTLHGLFVPTVLAAGVPFLASAIYGAVVVARCRDYQSTFK